MLTYLVLSLAVWYQLKCCYGSRQRLTDTGSGMQQSVINEAINYLVQMAQGLRESHKRQFVHLVIAFWVLWLNFQLTPFFFKFDVYHYSDFSDFLKIYSSHNSVARQLNCSEIFDNYATTNFPQNVQVEELSKWVNNHKKIIAQTRRGWYLLKHTVDRQTDGQTDRQTDEHTIDASQQKRTRYRSRSSMMSGFLMSRPRQLHHRSHAITTIINIYHVQHT